MSSKEELLGLKSKVETKEEALITLGFVKDHLRDVGHEIMAEQVVKVIGFLMREG